MSIRMITRWNIASKSDEEAAKFLLAIFLSLIVLLHLDSSILLPLKNVELRFDMSIVYRDLHLR